VKVDETGLATENKGKRYVNHSQCGSCKDERTSSCSEKRDLFRPPQAFEELQETQVRSLSLLNAQATIELSVAVAGLYRSFGSESCTRPVAICICYGLCKRFGSMNANKRYASKLSINSICHFVISIL